MIRVLNAFNGSVLHTFSVRDTHIATNVLNYISLYISMNI